MEQLNPNANSVLIKAFNNSCKALGINRDHASKIIGVDRATLSRHRVKGFDPDSKIGELCLHVVRVYRSLYAIAGGDQTFMRHWLNTSNTALGSTPLELLTSIQGIVQINQYLDAMRGKV